MAGSSGKGSLVVAAFAAVAGVSSTRCGGLALEDMRTNRDAAGIDASSGPPTEEDASRPRDSAGHDSDRDAVGHDVAGLDVADRVSPPYGDGAVSPIEATTSTDATSDGADAASDAPDSASCPGGWVSHSGVCVVDLTGAWAPSVDANSDGPDTVATLGAVTRTSVSVVQSHAGPDGYDCGCNAQHLNIPLGRTFACATTTLAFDYATTATPSADNTPAVNIRFCTGPCPATDGGAGGPHFYAGPQYVGSPFAPAGSACGYEWENEAGSMSLNAFPASAAIAATNTIPLGSYLPPEPGDACTGTFDTIDVHLQVYNCFAYQTGTSTLSNLRLY